MDVFGLNTILIFSSIVLALIYQCIFRYWDYFSRHDVKFIRGVPILGTHYKVPLGKQALVTSYEECYNKYPKEKIIGIYEMFGNPVYMIRDPDLLKQIAIKDFDHFPNHQYDVREESDSLFGRVVFFMRDKRWKDTRAILTPIFTASKLRLMFNFITEYSPEFINELKKEIKYNSDAYDMKDLFTRYICDILATCAFGINVNSLKEKNNEFFTIGIKLANFDTIQSLKFFAYGSIPKIMNFFKIQFIAEENANYLRKLIGNNIRYREQNNIIRHDMINVLMEVRNETFKHTNEDLNVKDVGFATTEKSSVGTSNRILEKSVDEQLIAHCLMFFFAGFNTIGQTMSFMAHELALNQDIQDRLYEEICEVHQKLNGKPISYEVLLEMKYMDMVVSETLRRWPLAVTDRCINKPYILENSNGKKIQLNIGDIIWLPISAIHLDPQYFPNPHKFDPERFSNENKGNIQSGTFFPFGIGPRNCIGSRFALMECKAVFYYLLLEFQIEKCYKTADPVILSTNTATAEPNVGFWNRIKLRNKNI